MENTIILNSGQKIEVLFQDEVSLDIDCSLRYIESGKKELDSYTNNNIKPSLDQVVIQAQADMEAQISQGIEDAAQAAETSATEAINYSIAEAKQDIASYVSINITPDLEEALTQAQQYSQSASSASSSCAQSAVQASNSATSAAQSAQEASSTVSTFDAHVTEKQTAFDTHVAEKQSAFDTNATSKTNTFNTNATSKTSTFNDNYTSKLNSFNSNASTKQALVDASAASAAASANEAAASAEEASQYAINASFGNIGDIKYTTRIDIPNGGAWCDGAEYTKTAFPDLYQMLVDGKLQKTDYATFNSSVSTNGSCGFFALNTASQKFKVPLLKDIYIKAGQTPSTFGAESLPNITGQWARSSSTNENTTANSGTFNGAFYQAGTTGTRYQTGNSSSKYEGTSQLGFDASRSSSTYQDGAKVNPDHVVYRAYVVLYSSAAEASEAQAAEFINALTNKANIDLSNTPSNIDYVVESYRNGTEWYRIYKSGWVEQGGMFTNSATYFQTIPLLVTMNNTDYTINTTCLSSYTSASNSTHNYVMGKAGVINPENITTSSFQVYFETVSNTISWYACGQGE